MRKINAEVQINLALDFGDLFNKVDTADLTSEEEKIIGKKRF